MNQNCMAYLRFRDVIANLGERFNNILPLTLRGWQVSNHILNLTMTMSTQAILVIVFSLWAETLEAQSIVGFWKVTQVVVGTIDRTPVAKWTKINQDGSYQSGNGGIQNAEGTWTFEKQTKKFLPVETNGLKDPYGGFSVTFKEDHMVWERDEEGEHVTVSLEKTTKLPKSPADLLVGLWDLKDILRDNASEKNSFDPEDRHYIFIRWDRMYVERTADEKKLMGYWHINAHRAEITFLCDGEGKLKETWTVDVNERELIMVGISESNKGVQKLYTRIHDFPK